MERVHGTVFERDAVELQRSRLANGGWEWWLVVGGEKVRVNSHEGLGLFTGPEATAAEMLPRLLAQALVAGGYAAAAR